MYFNNLIDSSLKKIFVVFAELISYVYLTQRPLVLINTHGVIIQRDYYECLPLYVMGSSNATFQFSFFGSFS